MLRQFILASVFIGFLIFEVPLFFAQELKRMPPTSEFQTIAHNILQLEAESLGGTPDYAVLDDVLHAAQQTIPVAPPYSKKDAVTILQRIATLLHTHQFRIGNAMLLTETCALPQETPKIQHIGDCDTFSFLYLAIGEILNLPLQLVSLPEHAFIRWQFADGTHLNWETTANAMWTDAEYVTWYNDTHSGALTPDDFQPVPLDKVFFLVHFNLGNMLTQLGRYGEALNHYTASLDINPDYVNNYYQRAQIRYAQGHYEQAINDFSQVLQKNPDDINALLNRGSAWNILGDYDQAIADFDQILLRQPDHSDALFNRGNARLSSGKTDPALADFSRVLDLEPHDAEALAYRGIAWSSKGVYDRAQADFTAANALDPWSADIANSLAWFLATCPQADYRNGEQAIIHAQRALALQPALRMFYLDTLAAAYAETGRFQEAITTQENAIRLLEATNAADELDEYQQRLDLYRMGKPYREEPQHIMEE